MKMNKFHTSVLLKETIEFLNIPKGKWYIDATLGGGGHTREILKHGGRVLGIDQDSEALEYVGENIKNQIANSKNLILVHGNFRNLTEITRSENIEHVGGVLFDLGISSHHIDTGERGFS